MKELVFEDLTIEQKLGLMTVAFCSEKYPEDVDFVEEQIKKRILANDNLEVCAGSVKSRYLVAASVGIYDLFKL